VSQIAQLRRSLILTFAAAIKNADFFAVLVKVFFNSGDVNE